MKGKDRKLPRIAGLALGSARQSDDIVGFPGLDGVEDIPASSGATIAVYSVKGGVGKTTFAANLAWCASSLAEHRTLLWDLDAAGGSGFLYDLQPHDSRLVEEVFTGGRAVAKLIRATPYPGLDVLPADDSIRALDTRLLQIGKRKRLARLTGELVQHYGRVVLDCPPVMNELSAQIIRAADLVIVPLPPSPLSSRALDLVVREIAGAGKRHPPILPVLSMLDLRRSLHRGVREAQPDWPSVPYASVVEQSAVQRRPVGAIAPKSPAAQAFAGLWAAIERKLGHDTASRSAPP